MQYIQINLKVNEQNQDQVIADLSSFKFIGFHQTDQEIHCYLEADEYTDSMQEALEELIETYSFKCVWDSVEYIQDQNWNDTWEQNITPQFVGRFFIKPSWSEIEPPSDTIVLQIDPKMSFGTGYHETTRLMLRKIPEVVSDGSTVLDAGTGTGILAIAAVKVGAEWVYGFDVDKWSYRNASENTKLNGVDEKVKLAHGDHRIIPANLTFDVVIANINRSVILPMLPRMLECLTEEGHLVLSGLTTQDQPHIEVAPCLRDSAALKEVNRDGKWICMHFQKTKKPIETV